MKEVLLMYAKKWRVDMSFFCAKRHRRLSPYHRWRDIMMTVDAVSQFHCRLHGCDFNQELRSCLLVRSSFLKANIYRLFASHVKMCLLKRLLGAYSVSIKPSRTMASSTCLAKHHSTRLLLSPPYPDVANGIAIWCSGPLPKLYRPKTSQS